MQRVGLRALAWILAISLVEVVGVLALLLFGWLDLFAGWVLFKFGALLSGCSRFDYAGVLFLFLGGLGWWYLRWFGGLFNGCRVWILLIFIAVAVWLWFTT